MKDDIPKPLIEYRTERDLQREMERLQHDEGMTAGLDEAYALKILTWAECHIEAAYRQPNRESEVAQAIRAHARWVGQIALMMAQGADITLLKERLRQQFPTLPTDDFDRLNPADLFSDVEEAIDILLAQCEDPPSLP